MIRSSVKILPFLLLLISCVAPSSMALVDRRLSASANAASISSERSRGLQHYYSNSHYRRRTPLSHNHKASYQAAAVYEDGRDVPLPPASASASTKSISSSPKETTIRSEANSIKRRALDSTRRDDFQDAFEAINELMALTERISTPVSQSASDKDNDKDEDDRAYAHVSQSVDDVVQVFANLAFAPPYFRERDRSRVLLGTNAIRLQVSTRRSSTSSTQQNQSKALTSPFDRMPKRTYLNAMKALTSLTSFESSHVPTDLAFRILQRLVTGHGVRQNNNNSHRTYVCTIMEKDFNMVLNAYSNTGRMRMARRVMTLQERTKGAPPLSPVAYSILLKGYGRLGDLQQVDRTMTYAKENGIEPDTVMLNSLMDAYINCNSIEKALVVFDHMKKGADNHNNNYDSPRPNRRSYNTILKGLANSGALEKSLALSEEMKTYRMWDAVTTNTLVHAAVVTGDFALAEDILTEHTVQLTSSSSTTSDHRKQGHPNVEAYTELLDSYAKNGQLDQALYILQLMRKREVEPNEITYTCLVGGLGRHKKVDQAKKILEFMTANGFRPKAVTYNALISGLVGMSEKGQQPQEEMSLDSGMDTNVDEGIKLLRDMMQLGVRPNAVTLSVLVYAMGKCSPPRVKEAKALVDKLERGNFVPSGNAKVITALVHTCGLGGDLKCAVESFRKLEKPDLVAVNTFLDACCRSNRERLAGEAFDHYFRKSNVSFKLKPDVVSYSVLICAQLKKESDESTEHAQALYREMKTTFQIFPDTTLVDIILKGMVRIGRNQALSQKDVRFLSSVLRDAELLPWEPGQLERRERTVRTVAGERLQEVWKKYGWNDVDSGFRII
jgi:pentatricopeptide repeat protein